MELIASALLGAAGTVTWFFLQRRWTGAGEREALDTALKKRSLGLDLSDDEIERLGIDSKKTARLREREDQVLKDIDDFGVAAIEDAETQYELDDAQGRRLQMLEARLLGALKEYEHYLDPDERPVFRSNQKAWEKYRDSQAQWVSRVWDGGSMATFAVDGEKSRMTVERIAMLEEALKTERRHLDITN